MKTPHPHQDILIAYAADTSVEIESRSPILDVWCLVDIKEVLVHPCGTYRLKPKRLTVIGQDGKECLFPEPMRVAPVLGTTYWVVGTSDVYESTWDNDATDTTRLTLGICQATEQGAIEQRAALIAVCGGVA